MSVTKRPPPKKGPAAPVEKPKTTLKQALESSEDPAVMQEVKQALDTSTSRVKESFYQDILRNALSTITPSLLSSVTTALNDIQTKITNSISRPLFCKDYSDWIAKQQYLSKIAVEELIRQHKLVESFKNKQELEEKLKQVSSDISKLAGEETPVPVRFSLKESETRKKFYQEQDRLAFERAEEVLKRRQDQIERKRRMKERQKQIQDKIDQEQLEAEREKQQNEQQAALMYQMRLKEMKEELERRKRLRAIKLRQDEEEAWKLKQSKPLFVKMTQKFRKSVELPELAKTKEILAKKREYFSPIRLEEIVDFARKHDEIMSRRKRETPLQKTQSYSTKALSTKFTEMVLDQERSEKDEIDRIEKDRRRLLAKQKNYASLVKQLHAPTIDEDKKAELEQLRKKIHHTVKHGASLRQSASPILESTSINKWKPKKIKAATPKDTNKVKYTDYLSEFRKDRPDSEKAGRIVNEIKGKLAILVSQN